VLEMNVHAGTGTAANYGCPAAGKTGTTDEAKDAWFVGYTPHLSAAVWVGYPDAGIAMPGAQGGTYAAPVWHAFMQAAHGDDCDDFPEPEHPAEFHPFFGKYAATGKSTTTYPYGQDGQTTTPSTGGSPDQKFDPRYYEQAPQNAPNVEVPPQKQQGEQGGAAPGAQ
jgi:penicillin-binding protein 1A